MFYIYNALAKYLLSFSRVPGTILGSSGAAVRKLDMVVLARENLMEMTVESFDKGRNIYKNPTIMTQPTGQGIFLLVRMM